MKKDIKFLIPVFIILFFAGILTEKLFHHSFEKFILSAFQRIDYDPSKFSKRISIIDTSPIYDLSIQRTNRAALADLLKAVKLGEPQSVGLDIRLERDNLYQDDFGDSLVKEVLKDWKDIVVPGSADQNFEITDTKQLANIQIHDGYELLISKHGQLSLPFRIASNQDIKIPEKDKNFIVNYRTTYKDIYGTEQLLNAGAVLKIFSDESLTTEEKQDELAMMLASQFVFIGFCNEALNVDRHQTPFGEQPGVIIWANALNNVLNPGENINYFPIWILFIWVCLTLLMTLGLKNVHDKHNFFYVVTFTASVFGQIIFWFLAGAFLYFSKHIYIPVFSFILIGIFAFPIFQQLEKFALLLKVIYKYPKIRHLPAILKNGYLKYLKEPHPFKRLHLSFTLIEECVRFSALIGFAQAKHYKVSLNGAIKLERRKFSKLTFGEWHNLMRSLANELSKSDEILEEWKLIYLEKDSRGEWDNNVLLNNLDKSLKSCEDFIARKAVKENSIKWKKFLLKCIENQKWIRKIRTKVDRNYSDEVDKIIQRNFGKVQDLINLRNKLVHNGGVYIENEKILGIAEIFEKWLEIFLEEKLKFWKQVKVYNTEQEDNITTWMYFKDKKFVLSPFIISQNCIIFGDELFLLSVIDDKKSELTYYGTERHCRFLFLNQEAECERIFELLEIHE